MLALGALPDDDATIAFETGLTAARVAEIRPSFMALQMDANAGEIKPRLVADAQAEQSQFRKQRSDAARSRWEKVREQAGVEAGALAIGQQNRHVQPQASVSESMRPHTAASGRNGSHDSAMLHRAMTVHDMTVHEELTNTQTRAHVRGAGEIPFVNESEQLDAADWSEDPIEVALARAKRWLMPSAKQAEWVRGVVQLLRETAVEFGPQYEPTPEQIARLPDWFRARGKPRWQVQWVVSNWAEFIDGLESETNGTGTATSDDFSDFNESH